MKCSQNHGRSMEKENLRVLPRPAGPLKSLIEESRKVRSERGEDFFENKKVEVSANSKNENFVVQNIVPEKNFKMIREDHSKLNQIIGEYDKKIFDQNNQVLISRKSRSKSIHLYLNEEIESFLKAESQKLKWGLRKNAGLGNLIQKFLENFIELKKREDRQLKKVRKLIDDFRANLVEFKKYSADSSDYQIAERANQKMKILSNDLRILLSLLEFEEQSLKQSLGNDYFSWVDFVVSWKFHCEK